MYPLLWRGPWVCLAAIQRQVGSPTIEEGSGWKEPKDGDELMVSVKALAADGSVIDWELRSAANSHDFLRFFIENFGG